MRYSLPLFCVFLAASSVAKAAYTVTWNTHGSPGNYLAPVTYDGTSNGAGIRNTTLEVFGEQFTLVGLTDGAGGSRLTLTSVPAAFDLGYYVEIAVGSADGYAFDAEEIRVVNQYGLGDRYASFQVRSSLDNFSSIVGTSAVDPSSGRNTTPGGTVVNYDQVVDISTLPAITDAVTFRLYFQDTDGAIVIGGSTETLPEGIRVTGPDAYTVPEPSALLLAGLSSGLLLRRRRR